MLKKLTNVNVWVHDQDEALAFYTEKLGMELRDDVTVPELGNFRWLTGGLPSVGRDPGTQPTGILGDLLLRICAHMTGAVVDLDDAAGNILAQPLAVRGRDEHVCHPVADEHRNGDVRRVEPPRLHEREAVVDPAADTI